MRDKKCLAAIFAPRHQSVSSGPLGCIVFQTKVAHLRFCLVRIKMPLLTCSCVVPSRCSELFVRMFVGLCIPNPFCHKNPCVRKIVCPQFWGRKWLRQFCGRLEKCVLSAGKTHVHKVPPFRGGFGGGSADFIFMGARIFLILVPEEAFF